MLIVIHSPCSWKSVPLEFPHLFLSSLHFRPSRPVCLLYESLCFGYICSLVRFCLLRSFPHFLIKLLVYLRLACTSSLYISDVCMCARLLSRVQLCGRMDSSPPGSYVHGIFQARVLERAAIFLPQENLPDPGMELSLESPALAGRFFTTSDTWDSHILDINPLLDISLANMLSH